MIDVILPDPNFISSPRIKLISWNAGKKSIIDSLLPEFRDRSISTVMSVAETSSLADLSNHGYIGHRHQSDIMRGLCVYISSHLQNYACINHTKYTMNGQICLPHVEGKGKPITIGFIASYRSPSLTTNAQHEDYLTDISEVLERQCFENEMVYLE